MNSATVTVLWVTSLLMILCTLVFTYRSFRARTEIKHFYYLTALITLIAATLYMTMASGYGGIGLNGKVILFGRYIDWVITTPLLLMNLALIALPRNFPSRLAVIGTMIAADVYMIVSGLGASLIRSNFRWAFFAVSCAGFLAVLYFIVVKLTPEANVRSGPVQRHYSTLAIMLIALWVCYPIVWILGTEGFGVISLLPEVILYAILDILAKGAFGFVLLSKPGVLLEAERETAPINSVAAQW
ncbi:rhodopsin [Ktedonobacter sp. SOSP1-85]|uniref:bacteriorhodopsin n=1 Tax=Ktedonobacter sp. SOSP1-85 TaxID=2778367 RepID=UPI0019160651|nr:bacteriorhodopsin [Ktedonobacter sp. SOSP1-85]GHO81724.1 rhodopsin [Ktedonobacter sp. SOSP1-85]